MSYGTAAHPFGSAAPENLPLPATATTAAATASQSTIVSELATNPSADVYDYGIAVYVATASTPQTTVTCTEPWGTCDFAGRQIPIPVGATPSSGSDAEMIIIDPTTNLVYTLWVAAQTTSGWTANWGTVDSLTGNGTSDIYGYYGTSGSGMSMLTGLISLADVHSGQIDHALGFSSSHNCTTFIAPATKSDGTQTTNCLPEGARVRLDPSINLAAIPGITPIELMVGRALQTYGAFDKDSGGSSFAIGFQEPTATDNPYASLGIPWDYWNMPHIPWTALQITNA